MTAVTAAPAGAALRHTTVRRSQVTASFTYRGKAPDFRDLRLKIVRSGVVAYDRPVRSGFCGGACWPGAASGPSVHVVRLDRGSELQVVLDLYSGGAHCCSLEQVFSYDARARTYRQVERNFGDPLAELKVLGRDGRSEFVSADDRFASAFTSFAGSGLPIQIFSFSSGRFHDVTRSYPALIVKDAARWWRVYRSNLIDGQGVIAAWAADEYMLGKAAAARRTLDSERAKQHLTKSFVRELETFLRRNGYGR
jgi:hypothetical protein